LTPSRPIPRTIFMCPTRSSGNPDRTRKRKQKRKRCGAWKNCPPACANPSAAQEQIERPCPPMTRMRLGIA
jgi:hypothetical protein